MSRRTELEKNWRQILINCPSEQSVDEVLGQILDELDKLEVIAERERGREYLVRLSNAERLNLLEWMKRPNGSSGSYGELNRFKMEAVEGGGLLVRVHSWAVAQQMSLPQHERRLRWRKADQVAREASEDLEQDWWNGAEI